MDTGNDIAENEHSLVLAVRTGILIMKISVQFSQKAKNKSTMRSSHTSPGHIFKGLLLQGCLLINVH